MISELDKRLLIANFEEIGMVMKVEDLPNCSESTFIRIMVDYLGETNPDTGKYLTLEEVTSLIYNSISESLLWEHPCKVVKVFNSDGVGVILLEFK